MLMNLVKHHCPAARTGAEGVAKRSNGGSEPARARLGQMTAEAL
jgi:hypothetical protein